MSNSVHIKKVYFLFIVSTFLLQNCHCANEDLDRISQDRTDKEEELRKKLNDEEAQRKSIGKKLAVMQASYDKLTVDKQQLTEQILEKDKILDEQKKKLLEDLATMQRRYNQLGVENKKLINLISEKNKFPPEQTDTLTKKIIGLEKEKDKLIKKSQNNEAVLKKLVQAGQQLTDENKLLKKEKAQYWTKFNTLNTKIADRDNIIRKLNNLQKEYDIKLVDRDETISQIRKKYDKILEKHIAFVTKTLEQQKVSEKITSMQDKIINKLSSGPV